MCHFQTEMMTRAELAFHALDKDGSGFETSPNKDLTVYTFPTGCIQISTRDVRPAPPRPAPRKKGCPAPQKNKPFPAPRKLANPAGRGGAKLI